MNGVKQQSSMQTIKLDLGCGTRKVPGYLGIDRLFYPGLDVVCDLENTLPFRDNSVQKVHARSVLEHIDNLENLLGEIQRILHPEGTLAIFVPHWSNPFYYSDYTHRRFFGLLSFDYFANRTEQLFNRNVPSYSKVRFKVEEVRLVFYSPLPGFRQGLRVFQRLINSSRKLQLLYEYHLTTLLPCYGIEFIARPSK